MRVPTIASTADSSASAAITAAMAAINPIVVTRHVRVHAARARGAQNQLDHPVGGIDGHLSGDLTAHRPAHQIERRDGSASASTSRSCTISDTVTGSGDGVLVVAVPRLSNTNTRWSPSSCPISGGSQSAIVSARPITSTSHGPLSRRCGTRYSIH